MHKNEHCLAKREVVQHRLQQKRIGPGHSECGSSAFAGVDMDWQSDAPALARDVAKQEILESLVVRRAIIAWARSPISEISLVDGPRFCFRGWLEVERAV